MNCFEFADHIFKCIVFKIIYTPAVQRTCGETPPNNWPVLLKTGSHLVVDLSFPIQFESNKRLFAEIPTIQFSPALNVVILDIGHALAHYSILQDNLQKLGHQIFTY